MFDRVETGDALTFEFLAAASTDDRLHFMSGDRVRLVLRNRQQVEAALVDFHDELNHLNVNKCLRLLNERFVLAASPSRLSRFDPDDPVPTS